MTVLVIRAGLRNHELLSTFRVIHYVNLFYTVYDLKRLKLSCFGQTKYNDLGGGNSLSDLVPPRGHTVTATESRAG